MIKTLIASKFKQIENETLAMLKKILRKDSFIDLVELDENFNLYLYKEQIYQLDELENLVRNIGHEELEKRIGKAGTARLLEAFSIDSISRLRSNIKKLNWQRTMFNAPISLYKRIELNQLSKGEKQIFILALYYAIIKVSGKDIPFIIDTPYARIDTEHREQISKEFFPNISSQVVILSTDEEVTKHYYNVLKPFIAKEYLLEYDETAS
jgi:DNA sulfur modification protein DndD